MIRNNRKLVMVLVFLSAFGHPIKHFAQSPPALPTLPSGRLLDMWEFSGTNFLSEFGYSPTSLTNVSLVSTWAGNGLLVDDTNAAWITYPVVEANGHTNLNCSQGTIEMWFSPDWNSSDGIGNWGTLLGVGTWDTNLSTAAGAWGLYISPDASTIDFSSETNGVFTNYLNAPIAWNAGDWHHIAVTFSATNSALYLEGQFVTNGPGINVIPSAGILTNGFSIGSDGLGTGMQQSRGIYNNLATYNYQLSAETISNNYAYDSQDVYPLPSSGGGGRFSHGDSAPDCPGGDCSGGTNTGGGVTFSSPTYTTNDFYLQFAGVTNNTSYLVVHSPSNGVAFDIFITTNLNFVPGGLNATNWLWLLRGTAGQTNFALTNIYPNACFFLAAYTNDTDGDGLTDAFEILVSKTSPTNAITFGGLPDAWIASNGLIGNSSVASQDPDSDGLNNGQEYLYGTKPLVSEGFNVWVANPSGFSGIP